MSDWPQPASFTDPDSGARESLGYFDGPGGPLYGVVHRPSDPTGLAVLVVSPFMVEFQRNYRREVLLARSLASRGVTTLRFSFRGQGHSGGDPGSLGFDAAVEDTVRAAEHLRGELDVSELVLACTRTGGLIGASAAKDAGANRMTVGDPLLTGAAWIRELGRAAKVQAMRDPGSDQAPLGDRFESADVTDVFGSALHERLYREFAEGSLLEAMPDTIERVLFVKYGGKIPGNLQRAADELGERGIATDLEVVSEEEGWWASRRADYFVSESARPLTRELIPLLTEWIAR